MRIGERDPARPHGLQQTRHADRAVGGDLERVERSVLEAAVQHVDRFEPVERA